MVTPNQGGSIPLTFRSPSAGSKDSALNPPPKKNWVKRKVKSGSPPIPENWSVLSVSDLSIKGSYPNNLKIRKVARMQNLSGSWLRSLEEDHRPDKGRVGKTGKRDPLRGSMGTPDPYEAAKRAVEWVQALQRSAQVFREQQEAEQQLALEMRKD